MMAFITPRITESRSPLEIRRERRRQILTRLDPAEINLICKALGVYAGILEANKKHEKRLRKLYRLAKQLEE